MSQAHEKREGAGDLGIAFSISARRKSIVSLGRGTPIGDTLARGDILSPPPGMWPANFGFRRGSDVAQEKMGVLRNEETSRPAFIDECCSRAYATADG